MKELNEYTKQNKKKKKNVLKKYFTKKKKERKKKEKMWLQLEPSPVTVPHTNSSYAFTMLLTTKLWTDFAPDSCKMR